MLVEFYASERPSARVPRLARTRAISAWPVIPRGSSGLLSPAEQEHQRQHGSDDEQRHEVTKVDPPPLACRVRPFITRPCPAERAEPQSFRPDRRGGLMAVGVWPARWV